ncbi:MAG: S-adenosylmethionine:tRNA ribosyltransferase-isomerase [Bacteroidales bacterium]|nr:S-adenosylmethionine:tRNA ribosyltransferase-isomerase [Bacteroidales bacterium]
MLDELKRLRIEDYDYPLPNERIARYPLAERDHSKLLCLKGDTITEHHFYDLPSMLPERSLLVFNDTKVIHARLLFHKETGALIEVFCLEPYNMAVSEAFEQRERCSWICFIGNNKKWKEGALSGMWRVESGEFCLTAERREAVGNAWIVDFCWTGGMSFAEVIEAAGVIPLPPYLGREAEADDATRYQTVYAHYDGSVAAPTAGLHFTPALISQLQNQGIETDYVTLHVGAGTFKPVSTDTIGEHEMHTEHVVIGRTLIEKLQQLDRPLVAVGTTSVRTLESLYWYGVRLAEQPDSPMQVGQWNPYSLPSLSRTEALGNVLRHLDRQHSTTLVGETQLMIAPGYRYRLVDGLITNFHQPKSTLLLLVSALIGDRWRDCYRYALDHGFRFLSYGDSCFFLPHNP